MNALIKFSNQAARSYLQSVVFIDDHIFDQKTRQPEINLCHVPQRKPIITSNKNRAVDPIEEKSGQKKEPEEAPFHPKDLVGSFAKEGIICALYEPKEGFNTDSNSEIFKLCESTDIIILDWDFGGDNGANALNLVTGLVKQSASELPHHTRLIAIYTSDPSLVGVANQLADRLNKDKLPAAPEDYQCRIRSGATRITVFGKPRDRFGEEEQFFTVKETGLAKKLIEEFIGMNCGILPAYALHGLAAIRRNSKRILDRFHSDLDGAFILHRNLVATSGEAFDQLPELLSEELRAIVEDERITASQSKRIAIATLSSQHISTSDKSLISQLKNGTNAKKVIRKIPNNGIVPKGHLRLAALFCSRTQYSSAPRRLTFGTVVRFRKKWAKSRTPWRYAVCLIPACDCIRLDPLKPAYFPFWTVEIAKFDNTQKNSGIVLPQDDAQLLSLSTGGKAGENLWSDCFKVDSPSGSIIATRISGAHRYLGSKNTIEWIGQLKALHAHRIAHQITDQLSRVGVSEAEWLRFLSNPNS